jgi:hypothetical protein
MMMGSVALYKAVPIDQLSRSIRLLRLTEDASSSTIECELTSFQLNSAPPYIAISYAWGSSRRTKAIRVRDNLVAVRENLWHFLDHKRHIEKKDYYWVDAICIDQSNTRERNHQVSLMKDIYRTVSEVKHMCVHRLISSTGRGRRGLARCES